MNDEVRKILSEQLCYVATTGDGPNVVPIGFKTVCDDGTLILADVAMNTTKKNLLANGQIAIAFYDMETRKSYMVKGTAEYVASGEIVDQLNETAEKMNFPFRAKGAVKVKIDHIIAKHPGPDNDQEVDWI